MKLFAIAAFTAAAAFAADALPKEKQEDASREMLALQQAQIDYLQFQTAVRDESVKRQKAMDDAQAKYDKFIQKLAADEKKDGCQLSTEKEWKCAPVPAK